MKKLLALCTACCLTLTACALPEDSFWNKETVSAVVDGGTQLVSMLTELRATYDTLTADGEATDDDINTFLAKTEELGIDMSEAQEMLDALEKAKEASEMAEELQKKVESGETSLEEGKTGDGKKQSGKGKGKSGKNKKNKGKSGKNKKSKKSEKK